jgi:hypothetical protein
MKLPFIGRKPHSPSSRLTPAVGVPSSLTREQARFAQATALLSDGSIESARRTVIAFQTLLRDKKNFPTLRNEIVARTVNLYRQTNYIHEKLKTIINVQELQLIEETVGEFLSHLSRPDRLPAEVRAKRVEDIPFARFYAGVFALAHGDGETASSHFSRAKAETEKETYDAWGIKPENLNDLLPATTVSSNHPDRRRTRVIDLNLLPVFPTPTPTTSPDTSVPQTTPGSLPRPKKR